MQQRISIVRPCTFVYFLLLALTLLTWAVANAGLSGSGVAMAVLLLSLFKGNLLGDYFMGLKAVNSWWRWVIGLWLLLSGGLVAVAFLI